MSGRGSRWRGSRRATIALLLGAIASCKQENATDASCDTAAEQLIRTCDPFEGESFRAVCELQEVPFVTASDRQCVAGLRSCDEDSLEACDVHDVVVDCSDESDCPKPWLCDVQGERCVRCLEDGDCAAGRGCLMGLCFDQRSDFYKALRELIAQRADAGLSSSP